MLTPQTWNLSEVLQQLKICICLLVILKVPQLVHFTNVDTNMELMQCTAVKHDACFCHCWTNKKKLNIKFKWFVLYNAQAIYDWCIDHELHDLETSLSRFLVWYTCQTCWSKRQNSMDALYVQVNVKKSWISLFKIFFSRVLVWCTCQTCWSKRQNAMDALTVLCLKVKI